MWVPAESGCLKRSESGAKDENDGYSPWNEHQYALKQTIQAPSAPAEWRTGRQMNGNILYVIVDEGVKLTSAEIWSMPAPGWIISPHKTNALLNQDMIKP